MRPLLQYQTISSNSTLLCARDTAAARCTGTHNRTPRDGRGPKSLASAIFAVFGDLQRTKIWPGNWFFGCTQSYCGYLRQDQGSLRHSLSFFNTVWERADQGKMSVDFNDIADTDKKAHRQYSRVFSVLNRVSNGIEFLVTSSNREATVWGTETTIFSYYERNFRRQYTRNENTDINQSYNPGEVSNVLTDWLVWSWL